MYICLFTCLTTRAINLEIVEDLTTSSFLQAFWRHCSIFLTPQFILSDNTQTFKRAEQDLQILLSNFDLPALRCAFALKRIHFSYILARSPHWGGVYERLIGLTKTSLKKILGRSLVTLSELHTPTDILKLESCTKTLKMKQKHLAELDDQTLAQCDLEEIEKEVEESTEVSSKIEVIVLKIEK